MRGMINVGLKVKVESQIIDVAVIRSLSVEVGW